MKIFYKGKKVKSSYKNSEVKSYMAKSMPIIATYTFDSAAPCRPEFSNVNSYIETDINNGDGTTTRTIRSFDLPTRINFSSLGSLISVEYLNTSNVTSMNSMFYDCQNLTSLDTSKFDTSNVTDMYSMFNGCQKLKSLDVSNWDTGNVTDMFGLFAQCYELETLDVSKWDTSKVTEISGMFAECINLTSLDVSNFDTSSVWDMFNVFCVCQNLTSLDLSNWDTSNVTNMYGLFQYCTNLTSIDISNWDTSNAYIGYIFDSCNELTSITCNNASTIDAIAKELPTRTTDSPGTIKTNCNATDLTSVSTLSSKHWSIIN